MFVSRNIFGHCEEVDISDIIFGFFSGSIKVLPGS